MKTYRKKTKNFSVVHKASVRNQRKYQEFNFQSFSRKFIFLLTDFDFHITFTRLFVKDD